MKFMDNLQEPTYALLRIVSGFLFLSHGTVKMFDFPIDFAMGPLNPMTTAAGVIEIVCGGLIILGLFTRPAAFIASGMAAVAYWIAHGLNSFFPIANGGELVALYCFIFLFIAARGAGIWSVDGARSH